MPDPPTDLRGAAAVCLLALVVRLAWVPDWALLDDPRGLRRVFDGHERWLLRAFEGGGLADASPSFHPALGWLAAGLGALFDHLRGVQSHMPMETDVSGPGLTNTHAFLTGADLSPTAIATAAAQGDPAALDTLALFAEALGLIAGNFALHHLPSGGLHLTGSLAPVIAPHLPASAFHARFTSRGPYTDIVRAIPVLLVTCDTLPLLGCARYLEQVLNE